MPRPLTLPSDLTQDEEQVWVAVFSANCAGLPEQFTETGGGFYQARRRADEAIRYLRSYGRDYEIGYPEKR